MHLTFKLTRLNFTFLGNFVMGIVMAIIALILGLIFQYEKDTFNAETLNGLKEIGIAAL